MLFDWVKAQPWWRYVRPMIEDGLKVLVHVRELPPCSERTVQHRPSGGAVHIEQCPACVWHIAMAVDPNAEPEFGAREGHWSGPHSEELN